MIIEKFVGYVVRKKNEEYLRFDTNVTWELPFQNDPDKPLMLYAHIPFCEKLCNYCSFHRVAFQETIAKSYYAALRKEMLMYKEKGYDFKAMCIGGGTPTVLINELVETIKLAKSCFDISEVTVETNPNHLDIDKMAILKEAGVNRLSVGVQSFNDEILKATDRYQKYGSGSQTAEKLKSVQGYFDTLNVDMIFNFPTQTEESLKQDLAILNQLGIDQITYYPLMVSSSTQKVVEKKLGVVDDVRGRVLYEIITEALQSDYMTSTAWCFSKKNSMIDEYVVNYDEYAGLGSGAFGYLEGGIYANTFDIQEYITKINGGEFPIAAQRSFNLKSKLLYDFLMQFFGLSMNIDQLSLKYGVNAKWRLMPEILFFLSIGGLKRDGNVASTLSTQDQYYAVIMMREFFTAVNNFREYCRSTTNQELLHS